MTTIDVLPAAGAVAALLTLGILALRPLPPLPWQLPATVATGFGALSVAAVIEGGLTGFWTEHTRNLWGNQVWFDLIIAISTACVLLVPRARVVGMVVWPWLLLVLCTGCLGLSVMLARVRFLEARAASYDDGPAAAQAHP